jgi:hypothetical protein
MKRVTTDFTEIKKIIIGEILSNLLAAHNAVYLTGVNPVAGINCLPA